ncbi:MAG: hypothetical protein NC131_20795 [Roseburia sp.]|nr:hypothetical protein [Roseburia sp.]
MPQENTDTQNGKKERAVKIIKLTGFILLCCIFVLLLVNAMLNIFLKSYYPTYGDKRLFAIVSDSMEPEIPTGHLIVCRVP